MKKSFLFLVFCLFTFVSSTDAQSSYSYNFSLSQYAPLAVANELDIEDIFENDSFPIIPIGFPFKFDDTYHNEVLFSGYDGAIVFGDFDGDTLNAIFGYNTSSGLKAKVGSKCRYRTDGVAPNRIFKTEFFKLAFDDGTETGTVSFQIWLQEGTNAIVIHLGNQVVPDPSNTFYNEVSPLVGFIKDFTTSGFDEAIFEYAQWIEGNPANPTNTVLENVPLDIEADGPLYGCTGIPLANSVFTFTPEGGVATFQPAQALNLQCYPNPTIDLIGFTNQFEQEKSTIQIIDLTGRVLYSEAIAAGTTTVQCKYPAQLQSGTYILSQQSKTGVATARFAKI